MPTMPEVLAKGPILINLDTVLANPNKRAALKVALGNTAVDLATIARQHEIAKTDEEEQHLRDDWFGAGDAGGKWWPQAQQRKPVAQIVRSALLAAIQRSEESGGLPIDCYWVCDPGHGEHDHNSAAQTPEPEEEFVEVTTSWNERQVTFIIFTPHPPTRYDAHPDSVVENILITKVENGSVITEPVFRHP